MFSMRPRKGISNVWTTSRSLLGSSLVLQNAKGTVSYKNSSRSEEIPGRKKFLNALDHFDQLDTRYARLLPTSVQTMGEIEVLLRRKGAPERCHVISSNMEIDDREMNLHEALHFCYENKNPGKSKTYRGA